MIMLFNKDNKGSDEIKGLIGHIDKDVNYANLISDIEAATKEVIQIIGQPTYDAAKTIYQAGGLTSSDKELVRSIQYPIILEAYRHYIKSSDISHSNNGRKIRSDDNMKSPFEWMIDRDNENFERKYYKAVDNMLDYLDLNSAIWKASNAFKESQKYFVRKTRDFDEFFPITSRLLLVKLQPGLRQSERKLIIPRIGQTKYDDLKTKLQEDTALSVDEQALVQLIKEACVYHALHWGMKMLRVTLFPEGVLQKYKSERQTTQAKIVSIKMEAELVAQEFLKQSKEVLIDIEKLMCSQNPDVEIEQEVLESITTPRFTFDDEDGFVSL